MAYQLKCVNTEGSDPDDCTEITTIGIPAQGGGTNTYTPERIHDRIKNGEVFYVKHNGSRTDVDAVTESDGTKYVRTAANDTKDDNLLKQDSC
ncbi:DUF3892 domain-containing protein [Halococcus hamelinensis]|uniref:DUF3892 domain-containing protein n=1 Tax=Halococcus hamelinensis TaxID=332168 RepID=UPI0009A19AD7|nr:DUF3892 domain-containing protein [Halococcus hamelinensis]